MEEQRKNEFPRPPETPDWAQETLAPAKPPFSAGRKEVLLAFGMYVLAYVYLGSGWWALPLFAAGFLAAGEYLYRDVKRPWESWVWLACVIMIAGCITWRSLHPNQYDSRLDVQVMQEYAIPSSLAFLALHILAVYWLLCRSGRLTGGESSHLLPLDALYAFLIVPFQNFFLRIRCVIFALKSKKERGVSAGAIAGAVLAAFAALVLLVLTRSKGDYRIEWRAVRLDKNMLGSICALGLPSAVQLAVTAFSNIFVQSYINRFGADCMAGWTSYNKIDSFALLPITTISLAVTTFVGQNLGAGDHAKKGTRTALLLSEAVTVVVLLPLMLLSPQLISLFNQEPEVLRYGTLFIRYISPFYLVICINQIISGSLRGAGDSRSCMLIMLGSFVLFRQIYLMIVYRVWGTVLPVAMGYPAGWVLCSVILLLYYRSGAWKKASVFKEKAE